MDLKTKVLMGLGVAIGIGIPSYVAVDAFIYNHCKSQEEKQGLIVERLNQNPLARISSEEELKELYKLEKEAYESLNR